MGDRVNRKRRASSCQKERWLTNISVHPSPYLSSASAPTQESSLLISPIRSSFWSRCLPLKIPSRLMLMRHSPFGLPASGTFRLTPAVKCGFGADLGKGQHKRACIYPGYGVYLMKVPPQGCPKHHSYLPCRGGCRFEVAITRTRDRRYEEVVIAESRLPVAVDKMPPRRLLPRRVAIICFIVILLIIFFGLNDNRPARWEDCMVYVQVIGFEEETAKHSGHSEGLAIGEVHKIWGHTASKTAGIIY